MDMLSQRYACPFFVLDEFIRLGQFYEFNIKIITTIVDERKEQFRWEYFLHKVFDKSYSDFVKDCENQINEEIETMSHEEIKNIVNESQSLLDLF